MGTPPIITLTEMRLLSAHGTCELAPPAPVNDPDRVAFGIGLAAVDRSCLVGFHTLDTSRSVVMPMSERIFRADFSARHGTVPAGIKFLQRAAGRQTSFNQYGTKPDTGSPYPVQ